MASLEMARSVLEEGEALEEAAAMLLDASLQAGGSGTGGGSGSGGGNARGRLRRLVAEAAVSFCLLRAAETAKRALELHADEDATRRVEVAAMSGAGALGAFNERVAEAAARAGAKSLAEAPPDARSLAAGALSRAAAAVPSWFSAEELLGGYLDLHAAFAAWTNLPGLREARATGGTNDVEGAALLEAAGAVSAGAVAAGLPNGAASVDYAGFLSRLGELHSGLPSRVRTTRAYRRYAATIAQYLLDFFVRTHPLVDAEAALLQPAADDFVARWAVEAPAASAVAAAAAETAESAPPLPAGCTSAADLAARTDPAQLKALLAARGLKSGGTHDERAARLWAVRDLSPSAYPKSLLAAKPAEAKAASTAPSAAAADTATTVPAADNLDAAAVTTTAATAAATGVGFLIPADATSYFHLHVAPQLSSGGAAPHAGAAAGAWHEFLLVWLAGGPLADALAASRRAAVRRSTRTAEEWAAERAAEESELLEAARAPAEAAAAAAASSLPSAARGLALGGMALEDNDEDDGEADARPGGGGGGGGGLILDEDGKPVPYWLVRLHGLNIEYPCEICGGASYRGRRAWDRHFQEPRHAHGMRCLGVPNTKDFHDVAKIADVLALAERLRADASRAAFRPGVDEEFEDSRGNLLSRSLYEDLARQGLL